MWVFIVLLAGVGKTTLVQKACEALASSGVSVEGFYTEEVREGGRRVGFDVVTLAGERGRLSRVRYRSAHPCQTACSLSSCWFWLSPRRDGGGASRPGRQECTVGQYVVDVPSFENLALPLFRNVRHIPPKPTILLLLTYKSSNLWFFSHLKGIIGGLRTRKFHSDVFSVSGAVWLPLTVIDPAWKGRRLRPRFHPITADSLELKSPRLLPVASISKSVAAALHRKVTNSN